MALYKKSIKVDTKEGQVTYIDVTKQVRETIKESAIKEGICVVLSPHTTCSVFFEEFAHDTNEEGVESLQQDLNDVLEKIIPDHVAGDTYIYPGEEHYKAVESWPNASEYLPGGDRSALWNGDAHLKSTLLGSSETFEVADGDLGVGSTGYIYFVDFDTTRERTRKCSIIVIGE
ncbi:Thiamin phosphate synthase YjbQ, UPF0047 family [Halolactibacillus halophilus]|uniref:Secondary thiamine-phosphate synthase enzyme n=1 Tax=Halolactibacillus halophilus TaxID=306540 RepID=A0A1I5R3J7_9BACI|nr:YjbQ family protein [Halolactibacillus halophilus]GEM02716.1 secondary thiamine-phosphate synthase enzyme [Halolactibacillus halophilus]SFP53088.1 Thiamin phosphate synthase YjbQ, UPF0047 family [Halolactibacillus halophilus]